MAKLIILISVGLLSLIGQAQVALSRTLTAGPEILPSSYSPKSEIQLEVSSKKMNPFLKREGENIEALELQFGNLKDSRNLRDTYLQAKGGVGDGGGSGIACFNKYEKNVAQIALDPDGQIRDEYRTQIGLLWITDFFEPLADLSSNSPGFDYIDPKNNETPEIYLARIITTRIRPLSPKFAENLEKALYSVRRELWVPVESGLPAILDRGETPDLRKMTEKNKDFCAFVQIVRRKEINNSANAPSSKILSIEYDLDLYKKLFNLNEKNLGKNQGVFQQAFLILHEALYSMGYQMGHQNSVQARSLARILLADKTYRFLNNSFDFLYLLHTTGFLNSNFFGYTEGITNESDSLLYSFGELLNRVMEKQKFTLLERGYDCDKADENGKDTSCYLLGAGYSANIGIDWYAYFSSQELSVNKSNLAFILFNVLEHSKEKSNSLEQILNSDKKSNREIFRSECGQINIWIERNRMNQNILHGKAWSIEILQQELLILQEANEYCQEYRRNR